MKSQFISALRAGDAVADVFVLQEKSLARKKDGGQFLTVMLGDRTGAIRGVIWEDAERVAAALAAADFVTVRATVSEYQGRLQLTIQSIAARFDDDLSAADFIPATARNVEAMFDRLVNLTDGMKNVHLKRLLMAFWDDADFARRFKIAPAAKRMHHNYLGGLLEHTLSMAILVKRIEGHYGNIDMDLLLTGAILHDIGKIKEYAYRIKIDYTDAGRLLTHIMMGCEMVSEKIRSIEGFPEELALLLKHMIISHHGQRDYGSPEPPKTIEAVLLNHIDDIDAKVNGIRDFMDASPAAEAWTPYHNLYGRQFYRGHFNGADDGNPAAPDPGPDLDNGP